MHANNSRMHDPSAKRETKEDTMSKSTKLSAAQRTKIARKARANQLKTMRSKAYIRAAEKGVVAVRKFLANR